MLVYFSYLGSRVIPMRLCILAFGAGLLVAMGCGQDKKIAALEKQNQELMAEIEKNHATVEYDLQAKCAKDATAYFHEHWSHDKDTLYLNFTNHYNKSMNKCFILVEYRYSHGREYSWANDLALWDIYENARYANFNAYHITHFEPTFRKEEKVANCELFDKKCTAIGEFDDFTRPYMRN
jgi:quinol monooxygenase YgiN